MKSLIKPVNEAPRIEDKERPCDSDTLVSVQIKAVGLCRTDLLVAAGALEVTHPLVLGHECAGVVTHDPTSTFKVGDPVGINPLLPDGRFLGLHCDGTLQDYIQIPVAQLVPAVGVSFKLAAYVEPVAASMAVLKANIQKEQKGVIYHSNRISHLTYLILRSLGYDIEWCQGYPEGKAVERYDYAIETLFEERAIHNIMLALKPGGLLVVKSRQYKPTPIVPGLLVAKELALQAVNYYDFSLAMDWMKKHQALLEPVLGATYAFADWKSAFEAASKPDAKKIFISLE